MSGGELRIEGDADDWAGAEMRGGVIECAATPARQLGGARAGSPRGMTRRRDAGARLGAASMRASACAEACSRWPADAGRYAGAHMVAGTLLVCGTPGARRGPRHEARHARRGRPPRAPADLPLRLHRTARASCRCSSGASRPHGFPVPARLRRRAFRRYGGDFADLGRGEILQWTSGPRGTEPERARGRHRRRDGGGGGAAAASFATRLAAARACIDCGIEARAGSRPDACWPRSAWAVPAGSTFAALDVRRPAPARASRCHRPSRPRVPGVAVRRLGDQARGLLRHGLGPAAGHGPGRGGALREPRLCRARRGPRACWSSKRARKPDAAVAAWLATGSPGVARRTAHAAGGAHGEHSRAASRSRRGSWRRRSTSCTSWASTSGKVVTGFGTRPARARREERHARDRAHQRLHPLRRQRAPDGGRRGRRSSRSSRHACPPRPRATTARRSTTSSSATTGTSTRSIRCCSARPRSRSRACASGRTFDAGALERRACCASRCFGERG